MIVFTPTMYSSNFGIDESLFLRDGGSNCGL